MRGKMNSSLQAAAVELERQRASDSLKKGLEKRPQREDLIERKCIPQLLNRNSL